MFLILKSTFVSSARGNHLSSPLVIDGKHSVTLETHDKAVQQLRRQLLSSDGGKKIVLKRNLAQSHCVRPHDYKSEATELDVSMLTKVISVHSLDDMLKRKKNNHERCIVSQSLRPYCKDEIVAVVDVQAMTPFETLVDALLPLGLIPCVVPEFKGIAVGGALQGLAAESTSFRWGFVHDCIIGFEALLCDGSVIWCSETSNSDLFHALPGSFGTLAICTKIRMLCSKAEPYVLLKCSKHNTQRETVNKMSQIQNICIDNVSKQDKIKKEWRKKNGGFELIQVVKESAFEDDAQFLEAIGYGKDDFVSIAGRFATSEEVNKIITSTRYNNDHNSIDESHKNNSTSTISSHDIEVEGISSCNTWGDLWFFNQVKNAVSKKNAQRNQNENTSNKPLDTYMIFPTKDYMFRHDRGSFWMASYRIPQALGRFMGSVLDSTRMFELATALPWLFPKSSICLQDFMLPREMCADFHDRVQDLLDIFPIWLLPMRRIRPSKKSIFAAPENVQSHLCNVGVYGIPKKKYHYETCNKALENLLYLHNGRKVYYSHSFYDRDFFYENLHDGRRYFDLRRKYGVGDSLPDIYDKICMKPGGAL